MPEIIFKAKSESYPELALVSTETTNDQESYPIATIVPLAHKAEKIVLAIIIKQQTATFSSPHLSYPIFYPHHYPYHEFQYIPTEGLPDTTCCCNIS